MDFVTLAMGLFSMGFGVFTTFLRFTNPAKLGKLEPMREKFGPDAGTAIHVLAYSVVPIVFGTTMLAAAVLGVTVY